MNIFICSIIENGALIAAAMPEIQACQLKMQNARISGDAYEGKISWCHELLMILIDCIIDTQWLDCLKKCRR
jgi:hypothetical protein